MGKNLNLEVVSQGRKFAEYLARVIRQEKEIKDNQIGKQVKLSHFHTT